MILGFKKYLQVINIDSLFVKAVKKSCL